MTKEERYNELYQLLLKESSSANVELCFETTEGETMVVDNPDVLTVMNQILEEAYLPFLTRVIIDAGYERVGV